LLEISQASPARPFDKDSVNMKTLEWLEAVDLVPVEVKLTLRPTVNRPVSLGVKPHLGPKTRFLLLSDSCGFVDVGRPF
jgi:hypothetical protein